MVFILPRTGRSPFQLYLVALIVLGGIGILTNVSKNPITDAMGETNTTVWGVFLTLGGLLVLTGIYWPKDTITSLIIERSGVIALGGASLIWSISVLWKVHSNGLFSSVLTFGLFLACLAQYRWLNKNVNSVIKAIDEHR